MNTHAARKTFLNMPQGFGLLFFLQFLSTTSFAVLFASLVLYMNTKMGFSAHDANIITGVYFACNFALHQFSGFIGGRYLSYRVVVIVGVLGQLVGVLALAEGSLPLFYWGLAFMLIGTGTLVTSLNMLLSQLFSRDDVSRRETAFFWNYASMNLAFIMGSVMTGYFQLQSNYTPLFIAAAVLNVVTLGLLGAGFHRLRDLDTALLKAKSPFKRNVIGVVMVVILLPVLHFLLQRADIGDIIILGIGAVMVLILLYGVFSHQHAERKRFLVFFILLMSAQIFWVVYQLAPMSLMFFAKNNVNLNFWGISFAPGWFPSINGITICIGAPLLAYLFAKSRKRKSLGFSVPVQYTIGLVISGVGLLLLPLGIAFAGPDGHVNFFWLFAMLVMEAIAEIFLSPVGYAMVGQMVPARWQSLCMGSVLLNSGVAAVLASFFSNHASGNIEGASPIVTNVSYSHAFSQLGWAIVGIAFIVLLLTPLLNRWMGHAHSIKSSSKKVSKA
ncbi:MAG: di-/tripeptide transporter [Gammaproteobacteria bacterium]|nr:di-/tripeptide transporter [Gammaproteobacteria bacterium]